MMPKRVKCCAAAWPEGYDDAMLCGRIVTVMIDIEVVPVTADVTQG
jgi:hypothetical protein